MYITIHFMLHRWIFYIPTPEEEALPSSTQQIQEGPAAATGSLARFKQALAYVNFIT